MKRNEISTVKCAVKRSRLTGNLESGREFIGTWALQMPNADIEGVLKCFNKWAKHEF